MTRLPVLRNSRLQLSGAFQALCHHTEDHHEAVSAFVEKPATYRGR